MKINSLLLLATFLLNAVFVLPNVSASSQRVNYTESDIETNLSSISNTSHPTIPPSPPYNISSPDIPPPSATDFSFEHRIIK